MHFLQKQSTGNGPILGFPDFFGLTKLFFCFELNNTLQTVNIL